MNKKIVCFSLAIGLMLGFGGLSVYAEETDSTQEVTSASSEVACNVSITNDVSEFVVNIPKNVVGSGTSGVLSYTVSVTGDIADDKQLNVIPDASFVLSQAHKSGVTATISQDKTVWQNGAFDVIGNGTITYDNLSAGSWNGSFNFNIDLGDIPFGEDVVLTADNLATYGIPTKGDVVIPSVVKDADGVRHKVTSIGNNTFRDCSSLTSINIPESVTNIGINSFWGCSSLTSINIPDGVTTIGSGSFRDCSSLTSINIPESVTNIGVNSFWGCSSLASINIPESVTSINDNAFYAVPHITYHGTATGSPWGAQSIN